MSRLLITGDTGLLGSAIATEALREFDVFGLSRTVSATSLEWKHKSLDLLDEEGTQRFLHEIRPRVIFHCAAATDVEQCEQDAARTHALNVGTTEHLSGWAGRNGVRFIYVSTDSVFDGIRGGYTEQDAPAPLNEYARSKAEAEKATLRSCPDALIVRTNFFGCNDRGKPNIGKWMYEQLVRGETLPAFTDVRFSPLYVEDLAKLVLHLTSRGAKGVFHVAARGSCTKYEFALLLGRALELDTARIKPCLLSDAQFRATRPGDTSLCAKECENFVGREMPTVQKGIERFAERLSSSPACDLVMASALSARAH